MNDFVKVAEINNEIEASFLETVLKDRQIPYYIKSFFDQAYGNIFQISEGWGFLFVPKDYLEETQEIVHAIRQEQVLGEGKDDL